MARTVEVDLPAGGIVEYKFAAATQKGRGVYTHTLNQSLTHSLSHTHTRHTGDSSKQQQCVAGRRMCSLTTYILIYTQTNWRQLEAATVRCW